MVAGKTTKIELAQASVEKLQKLVAQVLEDEEYAEKFFSDPEQIAREQGLSDDETLVVKQMNRDQFEQAMADAAAFSGELSDNELESVVGGAAYSSVGVSTNMIVGRSIMSATGSSYQKLASAACDCCGWKGGISGSAMTSTTR